MSDPNHETWRTALQDPFREKFLSPGPPDFDAIVNHLPRLQSPPALDQSQVKQHRDRLAEQIQPDLGHPLLDEAVLVGLASIDVTFEADHPRYGRGEYAYAIHDGFPGTIVAVVDALLGWDLIGRAMEQADRVKTRAAEILGIKTSALYYKLDKYGFE